MRSTSSSRSRMGLVDPLIVGFDHPAGTGMAHPNWYDIPVPVSQVRIATRSAISEAVQSSVLSFPGSCASSCS